MRRTKIVLTVCFAVAVFVSLGMGEMTGSGEKTPSAPMRNFTGTVVDRSLNPLDVSHVHCEGKTAIKGYLGEMRITLDFDKVESVTFSTGDSGFMLGNVVLRDGQTKNMRFKNLTRCYGESDLGHMMIRVKDLRSIRLNPPPPETDAAKQ